MHPLAICVSPDAAETCLAREVRRVLPDTPLVVTEESPERCLPHLAPWQIVRLDRFRRGLVTDVSESERSTATTTEAYLACGINCPGRCAYCVLEECASVPYPTFHANVEDMRAELEAHLAITDAPYLHLGHVLDPLSYPFLGPLIEAFVDAVRPYPRATLEIRTKFTAVELLPEAPPPGVVLAFSFAPRRIVRDYETGTSSLTGRLRAAREAARRGYRLGIRLDPVVLYGGWEPDYAELCAELLSGLPADQVADVVMGCMRGPEALISRIRERHGAGLLGRGEFVRIGSGKTGYPRPLRLRALRFLAARLGGRFPIRFCFEDATALADIFGRVSP